MRLHRRRAAIAGLGTLLAPVSARPGRAQRRPDPNPDAFIEIEQVRVGLLAIGAAVGGGRLRFRGEVHAFTVRGLEFGSIGIASLSASGEVFGLRRLEDFPGRYEERVTPRPPARRGGRTGDPLPAQSGGRRAAPAHGPHRRPAPHRPGGRQHRAALTGRGREPAR